MHRHAGEGGLIGTVRKRGGWREGGTMNVKKRGLLKNE